MDDSYTSITVSQEIADALHDRKERTETWDDFFTTRFNLNLDDQQPHPKTSDA